MCWLLEGDNIVGDALQGSDFRRSVDGDRLSVQYLSTSCSNRTSTLPRPGLLRLTLEASIFLISAKVRMLKDATPWKIFQYCQDILNETPGPYRTDRTTSRSLARIPSLLQRRSTHLMRYAPHRARLVHRIDRADLSLHRHRSVGPSVRPAVGKVVAGASHELVEKASLSLRILTMAMEQFAEFWGHGQMVLSGYPLQFLGIRRLCPGL